MKESEFDRLFTEYRDSLGTCGRQPERRRRFWAAGAGWALGSVGAASVVLGVLAWPRAAEAKSLDRMWKAVQGVRSIEKISYWNRPHGTMTEVEHVWVEGSSSRERYHQGTPLAVTYIVNGGQVLSDYDRLDHAVLEPKDSTFFSTELGTNRNPLDMVKDSVDMGHISEQRAVSVHSHDPVAGVPTYAIDLERPSDKYRAEILVDERTDLPFEADVSIRYHHRDPRIDAEPTRYRMLYRFNQDLPASLFAPISMKPVISLRNAENDLMEAWKKPIAEVAGTEVRDACVTSDGTVWIAVTQTSGPLPSILTTADGSRYVRLNTDIAPSGVLGKSRRFKFNGEGVLVDGFVPLSTGSMASPKESSSWYQATIQTVPKWARVSFAKRGSVTPGFGLRSETPRGGISLRLNLRKEISDLPSYFTALDLDDFRVQVPVMIWEGRAAALEARGQYRLAAAAYEAEAKAYEGFVKYVGYEPLHKAALCLRKVGATDEASSDDKRADDLLQSQER